ncbi:TetR/AcrR family transcriptional regulator [Pontixanthobacter sp. CEM42]|uniref:TetR/AcrR family transcriptional regulator n=1 Tax=Pontixanthobacter sp. CEM42 TaxID=2792077 RepID=UPI001ADF0B47|nr:TetR/AcrR family transcriptional regulator [Pontixanthobacter sp. CEM42]
MTQEDLQSDRKRLVHLAMDLIERRGAEVGKTTLASEAQMSRSRIDAVFPEESDLFDAILEDWYAPDIAIMEEVVESDLPIERKFYEFFARRFARERERFREDPALFALYVELGTARMEQVRGYIDLADHYMSILVAEAQAEGFFANLKIDKAMSLINQMVICYTSPQVMMMLDERLTEEKLGAIIDTLFAGLSGKESSARGVAGLKLA